MIVERGTIEGALILLPDLHRDERGFFQETFVLRTYRTAGILDDFVQDNRSHSVRGVLRGLHYQVCRPQAQLVYATEGEVIDVGLDLRSWSPSFRRWMCVPLSGKEARQVYWPPGIAHGYCAVGEAAAVQYKCSGYYEPEDEGGILWNDPDLAIKWPIAAPIVSARDRALPRLRDVPPERLPQRRGCS